MTKLSGIWPRFHIEDGYRQHRFPPQLAVYLAAQHLTEQQGSHLSCVLIGPTVQISQELQVPRLSHERSSRFVGAEMSDSIPS
jgi:hypothetical protein